MRYELIALPLIPYIISTVISKRATGKWLSPIRWISGVWKSLFGFYNTYHVLEDYRNADDDYWYPPATLIETITPRIYEVMGQSHKFTKQDYELNRNDCDDYATAGASIAHELLLEATENIDGAKGKGLPIFQFSFKREDNGKRHRLFFIEDNNHRRHYIDSWVIHDKNHTPNGLFRKLTEAEEKNGYIIG